jgi:hypothetical protein
MREVVTAVEGFCALADRMFVVVRGWLVHTLR